MSAPELGARACGEGAPRWWLAQILRVTISPMLMAMYRVRVLGEENLPADGGYVLAGNHVSYLDPMLLWCATRRPTHFMARADLFSKSFLGWLLPRVWTLPITRDSADRTAIVRATNLLKAGEVVGIFPEGTRQVAGALEAGTSEPHAGVAFIALRAGVPVVPVGISGTEHALPRGAKIPRFPRVTVRFGQPVCPEEFEGHERKERLGLMTAEIMRRVAAQRALDREE
jgi:1-acyl-sn-glycerol-3-phosphate acyltransferase